MDQKHMPLPLEAMVNCREDLIRAVQTLASSVDKNGDAFLYARTQAEFKKPPRYSPVLGLTQLSRALTTVQQLIIEKNNNDEQLRAVAGAVAALEENARRLAEQAEKLTRWDFLMMAILGRKPVIDRIKARRIKAGEPYVDLDGSL